MAGLIFDFDGLIIDSERVLAEAIVSALAARGAAVGFEDFGHLFGTTDADHEWDRLLPEWCAEPLSLAELEAEIAEAVRAANDALPLLPGVGDLLAAAAAMPVPVALATGSSRRSVERRLDLLGVLHHFDAVVTRADVRMGKPAPDIFLEAARRIDVAPDDCVVFEDSLPGCQAALAAGMRVVLCPSAVGLHLAYPDGVQRVDSLADVRLPDLLTAR